jgi:hypothetical protein
VHPAQLNLSFPCEADEMFGMPYPSAACWCFGINVCRFVCQRSETEAK